MNSLNSLSLVKIKAALIDIPTDTETGDNKRKTLM